MNLNKKDIIEECLSYGKNFLVLNPKIEGTILPDYLMEKMPVKLSLSYKFDLKVFELTETELKVDLSFNNDKFLCTIPLDSIFLIAVENTEINYFFGESLPKELDYLIEEFIIKEVEKKSNEIDFSEYLNKKD